MTTMARGVGLTVVGLLLVAGGVRASDVSGKWVGEYSAPDGQAVTTTFTFKVDGEKLTGTVHSSRSGTDAPIENGTVKGDVLDFTVTREFQGNSLKLHYVGKVAGAEIPFKVSADMGGQAFEIEMIAKRPKS